MYNVTKLLFPIASSLILIPFVANAQETCTDEQKDALEQCLDSCETTCNTTYPGCERQPVSLEEVRAAIDEECDCDTARNYGQYRSCVAKLLGALRKFSLIDEATKAAIGEDNKACKQAIKERRNADKPKGPKDNEETPTPAPTTAG